MNWIELNKFVNESAPVPGPVGYPAKGQPIEGYHNMVGTAREPWRSQLEIYWNTTKGNRAIEKLQERVGRGMDPLKALTDDDYREYLAMVDVEAVNTRYTTDLKALYKNIEAKFRNELGGPRSFGGSYLVPTDWWEAKPDRAMPPPLSVREELKPSGEGWVVEVRGTTYWNPDPAKFNQKQFIIDTVLRNIIERSRALPEPKTDAEKAAQAKDPYAAIRGKIHHAFVYNVWKDENPSPDSLLYIRDSLIRSVGSSSAGSTGPSGPSSGPIGMGPVVGGPGGRPSGPGGGSGSASDGWVPAGSGGSGVQGSSGRYGGPGGVAGPSGGPSLPPTPGLGGGPGVGGQPAQSAPPKGVKVKPRFEWVVIFVWQEPTPSDKLRQIKTKEETSNSGYPSGPGTPSGPSTPPPPPPSSGGDGGLHPGSKIDID